MTQYYPLYRSSRNNIKVELNLANYATKTDLKSITHITKLKAIDTNSFVTRTKFSADTNALDDKVDGVEKKQPDISGLATKTRLNDYAKKKLIMLVMRV